MRLKDASCALLAALASLPLAGGCKERSFSGAVSPSGPNPASQADHTARDDENRTVEAPATSVSSAAASPAATAHATSTSDAPAATEIASAEPTAAPNIATGKPAAPIDITFDDIKFDIKPDAPFKRPMLTKKIEDLAGKPVRIRGYILPSFQQTGLTQFVLVRDNQACCFGPGAALYDCIVVEMKPGKSTDFNLYPVAVEGTFTINELQDPDGKALAIYHLDGDDVR